MNKRDAVFSLLQPGQTPAYTPAAFFLHFDPEFHRGQPAIDKHLEYFRYTGMDFVKIQYENKFPTIPEIQRPADWARMPFYDLDFFEAPLKVVEGLVKAAKADAPVVLTLYSPFMCAAHSSSEELLAEHIQENPEAVNKGMQVITESLMGFVKACAKLGLDGFYTSTQGGEVGRFPNQPGRELFNQCVRPFDLALMNLVNQLCSFNILHICDYKLPYDDITSYRDYPGQIVNSSLHLTHQKLNPLEVANLFERPYMGGMDRKGSLVTGSAEQVRAEAQAILEESSDRFILAADCTVLPGTPWSNLRTAVEAAHQFRR
jgi:uroporphyrinogen decarboxylase